MTMLTLENIANKTCLLGLTYFNTAGDTVKQSLLSGTVIEVDAELGISLALMVDDQAPDKPVKFIIPNNLSCWFTAPPGEYHTSQEGVKIINPDYLVTWDVHQTQKKTAEGEQQWWEWVARAENPVVNG